MNEFDFIEKYLKPLSNNQSVSLNLSDDAAFIQSDSNYNMVVSTDTCVEGTHFFKQSSTKDIINRVMGSSLSDLAAMGADPLYFMLNITFPNPPSDFFMESLSNALMAWCKEYKISLIGGDTTSGGNSLVISSTVFGKILKDIPPILRSNAKIGDDIYVSGKLGGGLAGMWAMEKDLGIKNYDFLNILSSAEIDNLKNCYNNPKPRFDLIESVRKSNSCIDISDGLIAEAEHIAKSSKVDAIINLEQIPFLQSINKLIKVNSNLIYDFLSSGDEYQLLITSNPKTSIQTDFTKIGKIISGSGKVEIHNNGKKLPIENKGFKHF